MTTLIVVRHGQSVSNLETVFTGQHETPLTELGHLQAEATAQLLASRKINVIYSSDLSRAMDTARHTANQQGLEIIPSAALREIHAGQWEGHSYETLRQKFGKSYKTWLTDLGHAHPDGGESTLALAKRVYTEVDSLLKKHRGQCIAIFTHATPVRMLACRWFGLPPERAAEVPFCTNASVCEIEYEDDGSFRVVRYGYNEHQGEHVTAFPKGAV